MDVNEAVDRLHRAHSAAGLGRVGVPTREIDPVLAEVADAIAPWRLPADLLAFWRGVDTETLALAPCPRPADPRLSLRLWRSHLAVDDALAAYFPWAYESHDFVLVELERSGVPGGGCFSWSGPGSALVQTFASVGGYVDLLATMIELREFTHHPQLGVLEFDPGRRWGDAQVVRLAAARQRGLSAPAARPAAEGAVITTVRSLLDRAQAGESPQGVIRARVVAVSSSASGERIQVTDGTGRLDLWCPASLCAGGPIIERRFEFDVVLRSGCHPMADVSEDLNGVERAARNGDLRTAVGLATPLYDRLFGAPAAAQARAIRPVG